MTTSLPDWEEDLIDDPEEAYGSLLRALRRTQGFGLLFVECTLAEGQRISQRIRQDLPQKTMDVLSFAEPLSDGNVYKRVQEKLAANPVNILFIEGLEQSLYAYEDTKRHLGWSSQEIYSYSWKGVSPVMVNLNQQRENFRDSFDTCLVFLIPPFLTNYLIRRAPDFFDWRSGLFRFPGQREERETRFQQLSQGEDYDTYLGLLPADRIAKIAELRDSIDQSEDPAQKVVLLREQGRIFAANSDVAQALACFEQALELKPEDHRAWINRGNALSVLGRKEEAIASYDKALAVKPDYDDAWINRGNALSALGRKEEAIASYDQALAVKPSLHEAWYNRGLALSDLGRKEEAIASYDKALAVKPSLHEAWYNKACCYALWGKLDEALENLQRSIQLDAKYREMAKTNTAFDGIREDERFRLLLEGDGG